MKRILLFLIVFFYFSRLLATTVDTTTAYRVAKNFLIEHQNVTKSANQIISLKLLDNKSKSNNNLFYIFDINNSKGFIIISANDEFQPVLAYSFESSYKLSEQKPPAYYEWLDNIEKQMSFVLSKKIKASKKISAKWKEYSSKNFKAKKGIKSVAPLFTTKWNQGRYYNLLCPVCSKGGSGGHVWAGCVAASMAQVMKFWNYPKYGSGEHSYNHYIYGLQSADFANTNYQWDSMPNSLSDTNLAIATLMYHCGVAVNMNYGPNGSGAYMSSAANALKQYFDYSNKLKIVYKSAYSDKQWDSLIMSQIDLGQPISIAGGSHAFNIDGYTDSSYFHLNWGWGGHYNGYFYTSDLTPGSGHDYTSGQHAIIDIRPNCGEASTKTDTIFDYSGTFYDNGGASNNYVNCSDSKILIAPSKATNILLSFDYFKSVSGQDTLYIYDGKDSTASLLAALSGDTIPNDILSSSGRVFLQFKSDSFTTDKGFKISFTSSFADVGLSQMLLPIDRTCGKSADSLLVVIKNFGIDAQNNIPVKIKANTPNGVEIFNAVYNKTLQRNEVDTFLVAYINTENPGEYDFTCFTNLSGDSLINENDTVKKTIKIKEPKSIPYFENVDSLDYKNMNDWVDLNYNTWISEDYNGVGGKGHVQGNKYFASHVFNKYEQFFIYDRKLVNITNKSGVFFDYRILNAQTWPMKADTLNDNKKINIIVSTDCGDNYQTIFSIDKDNHQPDTLFQRVFVSLKDFAGQEIIFGFKTQWDTTYSEIDYDNILFVDSISDNSIMQTSACSGESLTIPGSVCEGGIGELSYKWQQSADNINWTEATGTYYTQNYYSSNYSSAMYFRRIVSDSMYYLDTSNVIFVDLHECTALNENNSRVKLYPNPTLDKFVIQGLENTRFNRIEIDNIQGQKIFFSDKLATRNIFDISGFAKGIYFVKIISDDEVVVRQIIKE